MSSIWGDGGTTSGINRVTVFQPKTVFVLGEDVMKKYITLALLIVGLVGSIILNASCGGEKTGDTATQAGLDVIFSPSAGSVGETWCGDEADDPGKQFLPLASNLELLPPLGTGPEEGSDLDPNLADYLTVSICQAATADSCYLVKEFTSEGDGRGHSAITFEDDQYHVNWKVEKEQIDQEFEIHFLVGDLDLGIASLTPETPRSVPIKFRIIKNPFISGYVYYLQGFTAEQITEQLMDMYTLTATETAWILNSLEYGLRDIYLALTEIMGVTDSAELETIFSSLCFPEDEYLSLTALPVVSRFAPVLKFDKAHKGLPMSADVYFSTMMTVGVDIVNKKIIWYTPWGGPPAGYYYDSTSELSWAVFPIERRGELTNGMSNTNFLTLTQGKVPTYFKVVSDRGALNQGRLRIAYWWYYGFQTECNVGPAGSDGAHHGDWEHIVVTTSPDRTAIEAVTYYFHGDWYTRLAGGFETWDGVRPVAYVGKTAHGSYHSRDHSGWMVGTPSHCCEYADYRNPDFASVWVNTNDNLVSLSLNEESWMSADNVGSMYEYEGHKYKILGWQWGPLEDACFTHPTNESLNWYLQSCSEEGCSGYTFLCAYSANYNQDWPIYYSAFAPKEKIEPFLVESLFQVAYGGGTCSQ